MRTDFGRQVRNSKHIRYPRYESSDEHPFCVLADRHASLCLTDKKICDQSEYGDKRSKAGQCPVTAFFKRYNDSGKQSASYEINDEVLDVHKFNFCLSFS